MIVCNHTAGVDPALVQAACPFEIRWMMAKDMMLPQYQWVWEMGQVIPVDRNSTRDTSSLRTALSHLEAGGVLGVFPEGKIEDPPGELLPFKPGVGVMIKKTGVPMLPVFIQGTPTSDRAWDSLRKTSRSKVTFGPPMLFAGQSTAEIISSLETWFREQATRGIR
jgi:1-acyl-sn-glycerol-3-phosphate acyltransferase